MNQKIFFTILLCMTSAVSHAMDPLHTSKTTLKRSHEPFISVNGGIPAGEPNEFIAGNDDIILEDISQKTENTWHYFFTVAPDTLPGDNDWQPIHSQSSLSFNNDILPLNNNFGHFYISTGPGSDHIKITRYRLDAILFANPVPMPSQVSPIQVQTFPPNYPGEITYRFGNGPVVLIPPGQPPRLLQNNEYKGGNNVTAIWNLPGRKTVTATLPGSPPLEQPIFVVSLTTIPLPLAVNANDSDGNNQRDMDQDAMDNGTEDLDIRKTNVYLTCPGPGGWSFNLADNNPFINFFLNTLANNRLNIVLKRSENFQLYSHRAKGNAASLLTDTEDQYQMQPGNGFLIHPFQPQEDLAAHRHFFDHLYVEATGSMPVAENLEIMIYPTATPQDIAQQRIQPLHITRGIIRPIRIRMNYAPSMAELPQPLTPDSPPDTIYNPSVIPLEDESHPANFRLELLGQNFLQEQPHLLQWSATPEPGVNIPFNDGEAPIGDPLGGNPVFIGPSQGTAVKLHGTREGMVTVKIKIQGAESDYMQFRTLVAPELTLPWSLQFFNASALQQNPYWENQIQLAEKFPRYITLANTILRQANIRLETQPAESVVPSSISNIVRSNEPLMPPLHNLTVLFPRESGIPHNMHKHVFLKLIHAPQGQPRSTIASALAVEDLPTRIVDGQELFDTIRLKVPLAYPLAQDQRYYITADYPDNITPIADIPWKPGFINTMQDQGILLYQNIPSWITNRVFQYTYTIGCLPGRMNFHIVKQTGPDNALGVTSFIPPHKIGTNDDENNTKPIPSETRIPPFNINRTDDGPFLSSPGNQPLQDIGGTAYPLEFLLENSSLDSDAVYIAQTLAHETGHALGLRHRGIIAPPHSPEENQDLDQIVTTGYLPQVDAPPALLANPNGNEEKNLLATSTLIGIDIDLSQAIIIRNSTLFDLNDEEEEDDE